LTLATPSACFCEDRRWPGELSVFHGSAESRFLSPTGVNCKCMGGSHGQTSPPASYSSLENRANSEEQVERAANPRPTPAPRVEARAGETGLRTISLSSHSNMASLLLASARTGSRGIVYDDDRAKFVRESSGYFTQPSVRRFGYRLRDFLLCGGRRRAGFSLLIVGAIGPPREEHSDDPS